MTYKKALIQAAKALAKKKIGPLRLAQTMYLPTEPLHIVTVGDLDKGVLPSRADLEACDKELGRQLRGQLKGQHFATVFFPPIIKVKELFFNKGTLFLFTLGSLEHHVLPSAKDLEELRKLMSPALKHGGVKSPNAVFCPPFVKAKVTGIGNPGIHCVVGSKEQNIVPSAKDLKAFRDLIYSMSKDLGVKKKNVVVVPATHKNYED